jgi:hypothetical protein
MGTFFIFTYIQYIFIAYYLFVETNAYIYIYIYIYINYITSHYITTVQILLYNDPPFYVSLLKFDNFSKHNTKAP